MGSGPKGQARTRAHRLTPVPLVPRLTPRALDLAVCAQLSGYGTTAKWIAECGVALARDEHLHPLAWPLPAGVRAPARPLVGGVLTPSSCFGFPLLDSFKARGLLLTQLGKQ